MPARSTRQRKQVSYRFDDYDRLINEATREMDEEDAEGGEGVGGANGTDLEVAKGTNLEGAEGAKGTHLEGTEGPKGTDLEETEGAKGTDLEGTEGPKGTGGTEGAKGTHLEGTESPACVQLAQEDERIEGSEVVVGSSKPTTHPPPAPQAGTPTTEACGETPGLLLTPNKFMNPKLTFFRKEFFLHLLKGTHFFGPLRSRITIIENFFLVWRGEEECEFFR